MRRIRQCLNAKLAEIYQQALILNELSPKVVNMLPEQLRGHFTVGSFNHGCLVLITHDPVWASQLRYHLPELRDRLRKDEGIYQLASIKIHVSADGMLQQTTRLKKIPPLSAKARETILASSKQCDYTPLRKALEQLGSHIVLKTSG